MKINNFTKYLQRLDETTKRLEITAILAELLSELEGSELRRACYIALGELQPRYNTLNFNIAEKMMIRAIKQALPQITLEKIEKVYSETGDLGTTYEQLVTTNESDLNPELNQIHEMLVQIAEYEGTGSQDKKISKTSILLSELSPTTAKYIIRIILNTMRLGFTETTIIDAVVKIITDKENDFSKQDKKNIKKELEYRYNVHPDIGLLTEIVLSKGLEAAKEINMETGIPILPQLAQRLKDIDDIFEKTPLVWAEFKFDGTRSQLHLDRSKENAPTELEQKSLFEEAEEKEQNFLVKTFTRGLENSSHQFPDLLEVAKKEVVAESVILDGEIMGYNPETNEFLPFQETIQRKRKHNVAETVENIPIKYFVFDILYKDGQDISKLNLKERKQLLRNSISKDAEMIVIDDSLETNELAELKNYFETAKSKGLEGLIVKDPEATYQANARNYTWVKFKIADTTLLEDSIDCVVLGYYYGKGARSEFGIGGFLAGIYDPEDNMYKTITKVGTGLTDEDWVYLKNLCDQVQTNEMPKNYLVGKKFTPNVWTKPSIVIELGADEISISKEHSLEFAMRFPRLIKFRDDKQPTQSTTPKEVVDLHDMQKRGYY